MYPQNGEGELASGGQMMYIKPPQSFDQAMSATVPDEWKYSHKSQQFSWIPEEYMPQVPEQYRDDLEQIQEMRKQQKGKAFSDYNYGDFQQDLKTFKAQTVNANTRKQDLKRYMDLLNMGLLGFNTVVVMGLYLFYFNESFLKQSASKK